MARLIPALPFTRCRSFQIVLPQRSQPPSQLEASSFTGLPVSRTRVVRVDFTSPAFSDLPSCGTLHHHRPG